MIKKLIVNADDFGMSDEVNSAILDAFRKGLISSTTLMANMPGFSDAVRLCASEKYLVRAVGVHLNLFEGIPLTSEMKSCRLFCNQDGNFNGRSIRLSEPRKFRSVIYRELKAQLEKVYASGVIPTHLDSHVHRHTNFFIGAVVIALAREFNIPAVRINGNLRQCGLPRQLLIAAYNWRLKFYGLAKTDYMGSIPDVMNNLSKLDGSVEIMTHPVRDEHGCLIDAEYRTPLAELLAPVGEYRKSSFGVEG